MAKTTKRLKKRRCKNALLLRARLVDRHGVLLRPSDVRSLHFVIAEPGEDDDDVSPLAILALDPAEVVLNGLHNDEDWEVDACGYNFCHYIDVKGLDLTMLPPRCELRYIIRDTSDEVSVVSFGIGAARHD